MARAQAAEAKEKVTGVTEIATMIAAMIAAIVAQDTVVEVEEAAATMVAEAVIETNMSVIST